MDKRVMAIARTIAQEFSKDPSTKVGAVIVDERNRIVSTGYNGMPPKVKEGALWDNKRPFVKHAEENAMLYSYRYLGGCQVYVTHAPCIRCLTQLWTVGVRAIFYDTFGTKSHPSVDDARDLITFINACDGQLLVKNCNSHKLYQEELQCLITTTNQPSNQP